MVSNVYVLTKMVYRPKSNGDVSDHVVAVFSDRQAAEEYVTANPWWVLDDDVFIAECPLNPI